MWGQERGPGNQECVPLASTHLPTPSLSQGEVEPRKGRQTGFLQQSPEELLS